MQSVLVLDFGSQYTQLIARRIRELGIYSEILPFNTSPETIREHNPRAIILSGGPTSVYDESAILPDGGIFSLGIPMLGICYGLQAIAKHFGGEVASSSKHEFGRAKILVTRSEEHESPLFRNIPDSDVWMSHGDKVVRLPEGFRVTASSDNSEMCAFESSGSKGALKIYALQFHPEVQHTLYGKQLLSNFLLDIAGIKPDWSSKSFIEHQIDDIASKAGKETVICGISGGVDSTVAAVMVGRAIGKKLHCVFVDNGLLRKNEAEKVMSFLSTLGLRVTLVDASELFLKRLKAVASPEKKRKIIGRTFIQVFEEQMKGEKFLVQGTLYPDVIESVSVKGPSETIKSHHNVGGLPKRMKLKLIEPLRELFKDEVRAVGRELGIAEDILMRHPFPGPGLAVRV